jgi:hypothetical protein
MLTRWRVSLASLLGLSILSLTALPPLAGGEEFAEIKLDARSLSKPQRRELIEKMNLYSTLDAMLEICGIQSNLEARVASAVQDCITPNALQGLSALYRNFRAAQMKHLKDSGLTPAACTDKYNAEKIPIYKKLLDDTVDQVTKLCKMCVTC